MSFQNKNASYYIIAQFDSEGFLISRATSFNLDNENIITASHFIKESPGCVFRIFLTPDDYGKSNGKVVELKKNRPELDIAIFTCPWNCLSLTPSLGGYTIPIGAEVYVNGYAAEKGNIPSLFFSDIVTDLRAIDTSIYCYEITQCKKNTITNYSGVSGAPLLYKGTIIGIVLFQQKNNTLYCVSLEKIIPIISLDIGKNYFLISEEEVDYLAPKCPKEPFNLVCEINTNSPITKGLSVQFSFNRWNLSEFSKELSEWLVDYVISPSKLIDYENRTRAAVKVAEKHFVKVSEKEFLDLLLHIAIRKSFKTIPVINKIFTVGNELIPSCSHAVINSGRLELWLGVSGYEKNIADAISNVNDTISKLITADNISERFKLIINDVSKEWPLFEKLKKLGDNSLSLDKRVDKIIVPVFICYEASIVKDYKDEESFTYAFKKEILELQSGFTEKYKHSFIDKVDIRLFSFPLDSFQQILESFIKELS